VILGEASFCFKNTNLQVAINVKIVANVLLYFEFLRAMCRDETRLAYFQLVSPWRIIVIIQIQASKWESFNLKMYLMPVKIFVGHVLWVESDSALANSARVSEVLLVARNATGSIVRQDVALTWNSLCDDLHKFFHPVLVLKLT